MTRWMLAGCMVLAALGAVGTQAQADRMENPFAGRWSGTYLSSTEPPLSGTIDWTIADAGQITGTFINSVYGPGTVNGHVNAKGNLVLIFRRPCPGCTWQFHGTAVIDGEGNLVATYHGDFTEVATLERN